MCNNQSALNNKSLQAKIFSGFFILLTVIGCIAGILLHERNRMIKLENATIEIQRMYHDIYTAHQKVTELAFLGESIIGWEYENYQAYREKRLSTDSLLNGIKSHHEMFIIPEEIDSLCNLLKEKEKYLFSLMNNIHKHDKIDSLLINQLPIIAQQTLTTKKITRKKKGIAGLFGKTEIVSIPVSPKPLYEFNNKLINLQRQQTEEFEIYIKDLTLKNKELNAQLIILVEQLDNEAQKSLQNRLQQMNDTRKESFRLIAGVVIFSLILLLLSYYIIQKDLRQKSIGHQRLQNLLIEYNGLLEMRKKIILTVSHDIRGPLNVIGNYVKLAMETKDIKKRDTYLRNIHHSYSHILQLVNNLLYVYRLNAAKEVRNDTPFHLSSLLERIAGEYVILVNNKGLVFHKDFQNTDVTLMGDSDRLEQIIENLLNNAIKFTEKGNITFGANYKDGILNIKIDDTGIGMTHETTKRIFLPFEQGTPDMNAEGYGLGLSIVSGIVQLLDGQISVKSQLEKGTLFQISLPMPITQEKIITDISPEINPIDLPKFVLVIEDDPIQLELCKELLEQNGIQCTGCSYVKQLVNRMRKANYDLLLTDIQMPEINGFDLLKLLRNSDIGNSKTIPIVAMTARGENDVSYLTKVGFTGCIHKPFSSKELLQTMSKCLHNKQDENTINFSLIIDEVSDKNKMLTMFIAETNKNIEKLNTGLAKVNRNILKQTVHRMFPMWEMLQVDEVLNNYRKYLYDDNTSNEDIKSQTVQVINFSRHLIKKAKLYEKNLDCGR